MDEVSHQLSCYKPSGAAPLAGVLLTLLAGTAAGVLLGAVYGFANYYDPLVYLNALLAIGLGCALGYAIGRGVRAFHIRSVPAAAIIAVAVFAAAYASHMVFYLATVYTELVEGSNIDIPGTLKTAKEMALNPGMTTDFMKEVIDNGVWSLSNRSGGNGVTVNGWFLTAIWVAEAAVILFYAVTKPVSIAGQPYSERKGAWLEPLALPKSSGYIEDVNAFSLAVSHGDFNALTAPRPERSEDEAAEYKYSAVTLWQDASESYVSVENIVEKTKKKKTEISKVTVVKYLKIPQAAAQRVKEALS